MKLYFEFKKGVSPLIATVLLIAFAVALGSVIMNWGLNLDLSDPSDECSSVEIKIREAKGAEVCYGGFAENSYINFVIDNSGRKNVNGLSIWMVGEKGTALHDLDSVSIKSGELLAKNDKEVAYDMSKYGNLKQVQFIPKIRLKEVTEICPKSAVKAEKIGIC